MASDDTIRAKIVAKMHRKSLYAPRGVEVDNIANLAVASHDVGRAKELVAEMAGDDSCPVVWKAVGGAVMLETDSDDWCAAYIRRFDEDQLTWDLQG